MDIINWNVKTIETSRGEKPVDEFINSKSQSAIAKITHALDLLEKYGNNLRMPHSKQLDKNLFELRIRGKEELRIFYCFRKRDIILLHGFKKQTQKTPQKEISTAIKRIRLLTN